MNKGVFIDYTDFGVISVRHLTGMLDCFGKIFGLVTFDAYFSGKGNRITTLAGRLEWRLEPAVPLLGGKV